MEREVINIEEEEEEAPTLHKLEEATTTEAPPRIASAPPS